MRWGSAPQGRRILTEQQRNYVIEDIHATRSRELQSAQHRLIVAIAATRVGGGGGRNDEPLVFDEGFERPIPMDDILFAFTKGAVGATPLIVAPWAKKIRFARNC